MYEKWLDDDGTQMQLTKSKIKELKDKIDAVMKSQDAHQDGLDEKEVLVNEKEDILTVCSTCLAAWRVMPVGNWGVQRLRRCACVCWLPHPATWACAQPFARGERGRSVRGG